MIVISSTGKPSKYSGKIITAEGIDGSGKTTNLTMLQEWLEYRGYETIWTEWGTSELMGEALAKGKEKKLMTPITFALMQAANIADRLECEILPHLQKGGIVIADRWIYTPFARDVVRGVDRKWIRQLFDFAPEADVSFYFKLDPKESVKRRTNEDGKVQFTYYEAGMDLKLSDNRTDGFLKFQGRVRDEYESRLVKEFGMTVIDADDRLEAVNKQVQKVVLEAIGDPP